jgi:transposase
VVRRQSTRFAPSRRRKCNLARAGKPPGATGFGRTRKTAFTGTECTARCIALPAARRSMRRCRFRSGRAGDCIGLTPLSQAVGLQLAVTRHLLMEQRGGCGHLGRAQLHRATDDPAWPGIAFGKQRLLAPRLAVSVVFLCLRMRLSRRRMRELMQVLLALDLSVGLIDRTVQQTVRAVALLEEGLVGDIERTALAHVDETGWREATQVLWLWVLIGAVHGAVSQRSPHAEMFNNALGSAFGGVLMSDGYCVCCGEPTACPAG